MKLKSYWLDTAAPFSSGAQGAPHGNADVVVVCANSTTGPDDYDPSYKAPCISTHPRATPTLANPNKWDDYTQWRSAARSNHPGGVNAAFADGSVRYVTNSIDQPTWRAVGTKANGEIVNIDF